MTISDIFSQVNAGSVVSTIVIISGLIEITPIKFSPLQWIGRRINAETIVRLEKVENKLDEHIAESYRNNILAIQDKLLKGEKLTIEEWKKALKSCEAYEKYVEDNKLTNDLIDEAMKYVHRQYRKCLNNADFVDVRMR